MPLHDDSAREEMSPLERGRGRDGWRFTTPAVLLLLTQQPAHGYELLARLGKVFPRSGRLPDPGAFYRLLRGLENDGAVISSWETPQAGPARRVYAITADGREQLDSWATSIERDIKAMRSFLGAYRKASPGPRPKATDVTADERIGHANRRPRPRRDSSGAGR
jgi:PadR family transcriptional regulator, regulatory protein PadR